MSAYAAVISLSNTIHRLLNHNRFHISLAENQQLVSLLEYVNSFQAFLEKFPDKFNSLEGRMKELAHEAEDIIECFMLDQVSSWSDCRTEETIRWLKQAINNVRSVAEEEDLMEFDSSSSSSSSEEVECGADSHVLSSSSTAPMCKDSTVGFEDYVIELKDRLCGEPSKLQVIPICGMAGIGKTTLARNVYDDPSIIDHFVIRVWITISQFSSVQRTLSSILECLREFNTGGSGLGQSDEEKVYQILTGRRYLVVMDSIWSSKAWDVVRRVFPDDGNGSRVMLTTRLCDVASYPNPSSKLYHMSLLNADQSWSLFKQKVFGDEDCPDELENVGKEFAASCKGWPLAVVATAKIYTTVRSDISLEDNTEGISEVLGLEKVISSCYDESRSRRSAKQELHLKKVMEEIALIAAQVKKIKDSSTSKQVECGLDSSTIHTSSMIGFEEHVMELKGRLCGESSKLQVIPICGMGGIGKTTLAKNVYDHPLIVGRFDVRVWVTISQDYSAQRILSSLVESLKEYNTRPGQGDDEIIHKILIGRRYLVVMDDIWSSEAWDVVRRVCPDDGNGSRIMLTTRLSDVASYPDTSSKVHEMSLLNAYQSWNLLKQKVFADENCPSELVNIGKEIARRCKGLPLAIVVIAGLLSTATKNPTSWLEIAENVKSVQTTERNQIEEILSLSYGHLPQYLRPCFLYMGSFLEDYEIPVKKLIRFCIAEGFVKSPTDSDSFEKLAEECLEELIKRNLVLVAKWKRDGRIKSCSLHDLMRDLCIRKAHESNFFSNLMEYHIGEKRFIENVRNQCRVSIDSSDLYYFSSLQGPTVRSIKCFRDSGLYLVLRKSARLLRVLDAEPLDAFMLMDELFHLRYLAISSYEFGDFPSSLSMLQNLQTLVIVEEKFGEIYESKEPDDLWLSWCMSQLRHVYYGGTILFHYPEESTCPLENLQTLSYVSHKCCTERILKLFPNLKKLKIKYCDDLDDEGAVCLDNLVHLHRLEDLKIKGVDREGEQGKLTFPRSLKRLTLVRLNLPLGDIFVVGSLPNLQVLNLKYCTCVGGTWETTEGAFPAMELLRIEVWSLKNWITESSHFPKLKCLLINHCINLNEIPNDIGEIPTLEMIMVTGDAKRSLVESVEQIRQEQEDFGNTLQVLCSAKTRKRFQILGQINNDYEDVDNDDDDEDNDDDVPFPLSKFKKARQ